MRKTVSSPHSTPPSPEARASETKSTSVGVISAILSKDLKAFRRDRFLMFITIMVLICWAVIFHLLPATMNETVKLGVVVAELPVAQSQDPLFADLAEGGVEIAVFANVDELRDAVETETVAAGIAIPKGFNSEVLAGQQPTIQLIVPPGLPPQIEQLLAAGANDLGHAVAGQPAPVDLAANIEIVGPERLGNQASLAEQMMPMILVSVLMIETFALASLLAIEIANRTVSAVLVTPAKPWQFLAAKTIFGTTLAFGEVLLLGLLIGAFAQNAPLMFVGLFLGSILVAGLGLLVGAFGRDFVDTLVFSMLIMIPMLVPAFAAIFPGGTPGWVKFMPTYGLVEILTASAAGAAAWADLAQAVAILLVWSLGALTLGTIVLRRKMAAP